MTESNNVRLSGKSLWKATLTAEKDLDLVLGSVRNLPLIYWRNRFFFFGAEDRSLTELTDGKFPKKLRPGKTHPVFTLKALPSHAGYRVCPCTSKKPFNRSNFRYIKKDCRLNYTKHAMDTSLHSHLIRFLLNLFHNPEANRHNAQLVFTTHDTTILDQTLMRRDQVWFVEKNAENATRLYPLSDYKPRKGEALQKGYLYGRYGALPFPGELRF